MKLPVSWLAEYIDISDLSINELADRITFAGIEIEGIEQVGAEYDNIVACEVLSCERHPGADHLFVTKVFDGESELQVVCGAPNCRAGLIVPLAKVGAVMPGGMKIRKAKLRGVDSYGMLCSASELEISSDADGIMEMESTVIPGTPLSSLYGSTETVFDVEITWNRPDCLSIIGIAREFSAILGRPLKMPSTDFPVTEQLATDLCSVSIENPDACKHYSARVLPHVERLPSPEWMRKRLELCGIRSIDIVVDVSNYVMLECGQPLHTFDYERVRDHAIVVRKAGKGETITTLDDDERILDESMLLITDPAAPLAVAGVMGGRDSEIQENTSSVLLESASFEPESVKRTATMLNMRTESSYRFERGVDPFLTDWASQRACALLVKYANATVAGGVAEADYRQKEPVKVTLRFERANNVIGLEIPAKKQIEILKSLGFEVVESCESSATFSVPSYRVDVDCEADLVEEVARLSGLDALPEVVPGTKLVPGTSDTFFRSVAACRHHLLSLGYSEIMNYSFTAPAVLEPFTDGAGMENGVHLPNPVSADYSMLRGSLIPQMFSTMVYNNSHGTQTARFFEMGRVFFKTSSGDIDEEERVCIGLMGFAGRAGTDSVRPVESSEAILWMKGTLDALFSSLRAPEMSLKPCEATGFESGFAADIFVDRRKIGLAGMVKSSLLQKNRISSPLILAEFKRDAVSKNVFSTVTVKNLSAFPSTSRDIALIAGEGTTHGEIVDTIRKFAPPELEDVKLFDIFTGKSLGSGRTSLAYTLRYRSSERTLNDVEVNKFHDKIKDGLRKTLNLELREG
jgi:phenylalanyl-tRNA synthetase beta chain